jgi:type VI secretion system protein ImpI
MGLILTIENEESLPNGAPVSVSLGRKGGLDIGRGATQDWSLPDPSRFISGKHCEVRYRDGDYWLYDISSNGTFLNSSTNRLQAPHRLSDGDRFAIGSYVIAVTIEADEAPAEHPENMPHAQIVETVAADGDEWTPPPPAPASPAHGDTRAHEVPLWAEQPAVPRPEDVISEPSPTEPSPSGDEFLRRFAAGAGVPEQVFARRDSLQLAEELGTLLRLTTENLTQLLRARSDIGRTAGVSSHTTVQALDNNPLKFTPSAEDALRIMFGPRTRGFLDARRAIEAAFTDLKTHQVYTFTAMQQAVRMLVEDFDPKAIDAAAGPDHGLVNLLLSRKARLWDIYVARWQAQTLRHDDGLAGAFMRYFGQCFGEAKDANMH